MNYFNPCPKCEEQREQVHAALIQLAKDSYGKVSIDEYDGIVSRLLLACEISYTFKERFEYYLKSGQITYTYIAFCSKCKYEVSKENTLSLL